MADGSLTYFGVDMTAPGVEVRPLRQLTGEAEFNEVFLTDVRIPDTDRIGEVGEGWKVANATLMSERVSICASRAAPRESGMISSAARTWRSRPELRTAGLHDRMLRLWTEAEVARLAGERLRQQLAAGKPGPEGSAAKLVFARLNQEISGFEVELAGMTACATTTGPCADRSTRTSTAAAPATATCAPAATPSRAGPRKSCATSSPSGSSASPPNPASTRTCRGRTCQGEQAEGARRCLDSLSPPDPPQARGTSDEGPPPEAARQARRRLKAPRRRAEEAR